MTEREIAFVTGAAQGIGLATARRLAEDGFRVIAMDRSAERLHEAVAGLVADGLEVEAAVLEDGLLRVDVVRPPSAKRSRPVPIRTAG